MKHYSDNKTNNKNNLFKENISMKNMKKKTNNTYSVRLLAAVPFVTSACALKRIVRFSITSASITRSTSRLFPVPTRIATTESTRDWVHISSAS